MIMSIYDLQPSSIQSLSSNLEYLRIEHIRWVDNFNKQIICNILDDSFSQSYQDCSFGKWYHSVKEYELINDEQFKNLGVIHQKFHDVSNLILNKYKNGKPILEKEYELLIQVEIEFTKAIDKIYYATNATKYSIDTVTGLPNRFLIQSILEKYFENFLRNGGDYCIAVMDIDRFKKINDSYGHHAGDHVLRAIAKQVSALLRKYDSMGRYGGEEFLIFMPNTNIEKSLRILDRIRNEIKVMLIRVAEGVFIDITCSFGISKFQKRYSLQESIDHADQAMYQAKEEGRNLVLKSSYYN